MLGYQLPEDMQVLISDFIEAYTDNELNVEQLELETITLDVASFPDVDIDSGRKIDCLDGEFPPVIVCGSTWMDGRHRIDFLKRNNVKSVIAIDLQSFFTKPIPTTSSDFIGILTKRK
jgi:hypothetical protein